MLGNEGNEITLIYNSDHIDDRKALVFLESMNGYVVKTINLKKESLTATQIAGLAHAMHIPLKSLLRDGKDASAIHRNRESYDDHDLVDLMEVQPELINTPITIWNGETKIWGTSYDLIKHGMDMKDGGTASHANPGEKSAR